MNGRLRTAAGIAGLAATLVPIRRHSIGPREQQTFRLVNGLIAAVLIGTLVTLLLTVSLFAQVSLL